jgi:GDP/UDP-N,N'-diacetylbacillosamine 2-epimerase (hydrolysing)
MKRKICVVTGSRAEYGLLRGTMNKIKKSPNLELQLIVTGTHLENEFGLTYREIIDDGFDIDSSIKLISIKDDTPSGVVNAISQGLNSFSENFTELSPDLILILGDRFEIFSAAIAALINKIPIAHLHGGEVTEGAFDEALRHSITKMSNFHFVANEVYRKRVIQLGEDPKKVYLVGGFGVDSIADFNILDQKTLENKLGIKFLRRNLLITFHPATLDEESPETQISELLKALSDLEDTLLIFTMPNADPGSRKISQMIEFYAQNNPNAYAYKSLGQQLYFSCISQVDGVVGNSSSGIAEVPTFKKGTINIGNRQKGRLMGNSIINCEPKNEKIRLALNELYSDRFQENILNSINPYGEVGASEKTVSILESLTLSDSIIKSFYDL